MTPPHALVMACRRDRLRQVIQIRLGEYIGMAGADSTGAGTIRPCASPPLVPGDGSSNQFPGAAAHAPSVQTTARRINLGIAAPY